MDVFLRVNVPALEPAPVSRPLTPEVFRDAINHMKQSQGVPDFDPDRYVWTFPKTEKTETLREAMQAMRDEMELAHRRMRAQGYGVEMCFRGREQELIEMAHNPMGPVSVRDAIVSGPGHAAVFLNMQIEARRRGDKTLIRMIPFINQSAHTVTFQVGDKSYNVEPGGQIDLPEGYTKWRGTRKPIIQEIAPQMSPTRIECETCSVLIGQADATGTYTCWEHLAPCGLPCVGRGMDHRGSDCTDGAHARKSECPRCKPKSCPACKGKPELGREEIKDWETMTDFDGVPRRMLVPSSRPIWCKRCAGRGTVDGLGLWLEEHG